MQGAFQLGKYSVHELEPGAPTPGSPAEVAATTASAPDQDSPVTDPAAAGAAAADTERPALTPATAGLAALQPLGSPARAAAGAAAANAKDLDNNNINGGGGGGGDDDRGGVDPTVFGMIREFNSVGAVQADIHWLESFTRFHFFFSDENYITVLST